MSKLIEVLAAMPEDEVQEMILNHFGNEVFGCAAYDTQEEHEANIKKLEAMRDSPLVNALSDERKAWVLDVVEKAIRLNGDYGDDEDAEEDHDD